MSPRATALCRWSHWSRTSSACPLPVQRIDQRRDLGQAVDDKVCLLARTRRRALGSCSIHAAASLPSAPPQREGSDGKGGEFTCAARCPLARCASAPSALSTVTAPASFPAARSSFQSPTMTSFAGFVSQTRARWTRASPEGLHLPPVHSREIVRSKRSRNPNLSKNLRDGVVQAKEARHPFLNLNHGMPTSAPLHQCSL